MSETSYRLTYAGGRIEADSDFALADKLAGLQSFGRYEIVQDGSPLFEDEDEAFTPLEYWDGEILFEYPAQIDAEHLLKYAAFSLDRDISELELEINGKKIEVLG